MSPTDQLNRPRRGAAAGSGGAPPRSLTTSAMLAGMLAAGVTLAVAMSVCVIGWFLADAGAHGDTTDALRVGADAWLVGHGTGLGGGLALGVTPLGLTLLLLSGTFRAGRWAGRTADAETGPDEDRLRAWGLAATMMAGTYGVVAVIVCVLASVAGAAPSLGRAVVLPALIAFVGGGLGLGAGRGELAALRDRLPDWSRQVLYGALVGALAVVVLASAALAASLLVHYDEAATVISRLHLSTGDAVAFALVLALFAPNFVLLAAAYLVGPGFAFGTGTVVSPTAVDLGAVPALPVLAAVPAEGRAPGWLLLVIALPILCGALGAMRAQRAAGGGGYDQVALRGAAAGFCAGLLLTLAVTLAGGSLGNGRLAEIGAPTLELLAVAGGGMGVGGLLGALATAWWQRRGEGSTAPLD